MNKANFKVDTRLTSLLGENYRSTEVALKELIDNAWDADAETRSFLNSATSACNARISRRRGLLL